MRSSTPRNWSRAGPRYTSSTVTSLPGTMQAATDQKAACDGSPGTSRTNGRRLDRRTRTVCPSSSTAISAPQRRSNSSVWARVRTASCTTVSPSAPSPASRMADFTWALATGGLYSIPCRSPPRTSRGGYRPPPRPSTRAPIRRRGSVTRSIGRRETDSSPRKTVRHGKAAHRPASRRIVVPELPTSMAPAASWRAPPRISPPSTSAPSASMALLVATTSAPSDSPRTRDTPWARPASIRAR